MSVARPIYKNMSIMLTRRIRGRTHLLRPSKRTNQIIGYVLAVISAKLGIELHAVVVLGNHWHVVLTDPDGRVVEFQHDCHQFIARGINEAYDEEESIWASEPTSRVECEEPHDLLDKIVYTMANPVAASLVKYGHTWPGLRRAWPAKPMVFKRPKKFFRGPEDGGIWPAEATLVMSRPPGYEELSDDELAGKIQAELKKREDKHRAARKAARKGFLGRRRILEQSRHGHSRSAEAKYSISPKVACKNKWLRIERLEANSRWGDRYRCSLRAWRDGDREVEFPAGTYKMRVVHGVNCARAPD